MATLEKLVKALEALKISKDTPSNIEDEVALRKKKKVELCSFVAETMCTPSVKTAANFTTLLSFSIETLLDLSDDPDSNIRLVADESLNRIIRAMMDNNVVKVHIELHKEIKKNGSERSLRAALSKFAKLAHMIRPQKGKAYVQNLVPSLVEIARRQEEAVLETLAAALPHILGALGSFTSDANIKDLLESFLGNLSSEVPVVRRTAADSIVSVCLNSRKPSFFLSYVLNSLLDSIIPLEKVRGDKLLGVMNCIRQLLPHLASCQGTDLGLKGSFGVCQDTQDRREDLPSSPDSLTYRLQQVYEACLWLTRHTDHNMVTTAMETLHQLILSAPSCLVRALLSTDGLTHSCIENHQSLTTTRAEPEEGKVDAPSTEKPAAVTSLETDPPLGHDTPTPQATKQNYQEWNIGATVQPGCPAVLYCCRRLVTGFLIPESGPPVRVSVRALALQCLTQLVRIHPQLLFHSIDVNNQSAPGGFSHVGDVTCFTSHSDQQLRGLSQVLIGTFISSALASATTTFQRWSDAVVQDIPLTSRGATAKAVNLEHLVSLLITGVQDESSTCVRHSLSALSCCLSPLLSSCDCGATVTVLPILFTVAANPYWLVKVKLVQLFGELPYLDIYNVTGACDFQTRTLHYIMLALLGDEDSRVRKAASEAIAKAVSKMYFPVDEHKLDMVGSATVRLSNSLFSGGGGGVLPEEKGKAPVGKSLSRVVYQLTRLLLQSSSKHLTAGCCEALSLLSVKYPPVMYLRAWHCYLSSPPKDTTHTHSVLDCVSASGLLGFVVAIMTTSPAALDLDIHNWLLVLAGNLFTGLATVDLKAKELVNSSENKQIWSFFSDPKLAALSELLLHHLTQLLCMFVRVLEDSPASRNPTPSPIKRRPTRATSPAKANSAPATGEKEVPKEEKGKFGEFSHIPHCNKLYESLRSAYANYKTHLESGDKLTGLLGCVLTCLGQVLELSTLVESGRLAEELLLYLRTVVSLEPTASVNLVQQLLKSLFGSNLIAQWEEHREHAVPPATQEDATATASTPSFYDNMLHHPLDLLQLPLSQSDDLILLQNKFQRDNPSHRKASTIIKGLLKGSDRHALASYIRLFEPMVIQALKQYTVTNNIQLQVSVLSLLTELVLLRVNYCLLDSDQIFIDFLLKQFEFLEVGQINYPEVLVPKVFEFLVQLSHEKHHSKPVISVAKVIQLCDGLMASGQDPLKYCIPALRPIVGHVFTSKGSVSAWQVKAMRDVVLSMLLRLAEYPQVLRLLSEVLSADCSAEECKRWSHQTADTLMPLLAQGKVRLDSAEAISSLLTLMNSFLPRTLSPPDPLLRVLFSSHLFEGEWSTLVSVLMYAVTKEKEHSLLARLEDLKLTVREQSEEDPLNASAANLNEPPHTIFARLLLRTLNSLVLNVHSCVFCCHGNQTTAHHLQYLLTHLLITCCFILKSNNHQLIAGGLVSLVTEVDPSALPKLSQLFVTLSTRCPLVVMLWCRLLSLLNQRLDCQFWSSVMQTSNSERESANNLCLHSEVVRRGSLITYCEHVVSNPSVVGESAWLLSEQFRQLVMLHDKSPVTEFLEACKHCPETRRLLLSSVTKLCATTTPPPPKLAGRVLDYLLSMGFEDSVSVLKVLCPLLHHPHLVLARKAAALACSRVEYLLILEREEVTKLLSQEDLLHLVNTLTVNNRLASKHSGLVSLLNKLSSTHYHISPAPDMGRNVNTSNIHDISLDKTWFLAQVRLRCCQVEGWQQCCQLLSQLDYADIESVLRCQQFNNCILQHCFVLGTQLTVQERKTQQDPSEVHFAALYSAALAALLQHIRHLHSLLPRIHQVYSPVGRQSSQKESKHTARLTQLFSECQFLDMLFRLVPAVVSYLHSLPEVRSRVPDNAREDLAKFGVLCAEVAHWLVSQSEMAGWPSRLHWCLQCAVAVLSSDQLISLLSPSHVGSVTSSLAALTDLVSGVALILPVQKLPGQTAFDFLTVRVEEDNILSITNQRTEHDSEDEAEVDSVEQERLACQHTRHQTCALICWLEKPPKLLPHTPQFVLEPIRHLVMSIGRHSLLWWYSCTPPEAWPTSPSPSTQPPLPTALLQDIDLLRQLIFRVSLLGWTSRTQFEETWMCLLTVLSSSPGPDSSNLQGSSVAVQAITSLLVQTLLTPCPGKPNTGRLLHSSRDKPLVLPDLWGPKLERVVDALYWKIREHQAAGSNNFQVHRLYHCCNMERLHNAHRYGYGQVSVDFLKTAVMNSEERAANQLNPDYVEHQKRTSESGLDLQSCVQFLLDLYSQWTQSEQTSALWLGLLVEVVRSTVTLSDLFCERTHFAWLLDWALSLSSSHPPEDHLLHQYLVIAVCKSAAVLPTLETEVCDRVLRLLESSLKSAFPPTKLASEYGLLYLLENYIQFQPEEQSTESVSGNVKVPDTKQRVLQIARDHILKHLAAECSPIHSEESQLVMYSLVLYMMEHVPQELPPEVQSHLLQLVISTSTSRQIVLYQALIQGLSRLVMVKVPGVWEPITRLALDRLNQSDPAVSLPALQLLLTCLYSGELSKMKGEDGVMDPEQMVITMEKTSALFDKVKKGSPLEVECVCAVLPSLLADFFPASEVLTKVIGEFLSPHQPNHMHLSAVVFQVLSQACREQQLPLLQAWLVMSLHIFTQTLPVATATWCLSCFFISASTNPWLRAIFPHIQSRMGKCTYEDRKLLCIAASDFYRQLNDPKQKDTFLKTFKEAATSPRSPFADVISSL